jgi:cytochrome c biogenesis protein CcmG/thiol:disulfide interchange protein DsbE
MSESTSGNLETQSHSTWRMALPLVLFMALTGLFYVGLFSGDPSKLPSALIGKKVPAFDLPPLEGLVRNGVKIAGISSNDLAKGRISIVNIWASWCIPCRAEHPFLVQLAEQSKAPLFGINYKDGTAGARRFLGRYGNPFVAVGVDAKGATAIDWGVYGIPETFIVGGDGTILYKHVGPIDAGVIKKTLLPVIEKARSGS